MNKRIVKCAKMVQITAQTIATHSLSIWLNRLRLLLNMPKFSGSLFSTILRPLFHKNMAKNEKDEKVAKIKIVFM